MYKKCCLLLSSLVVASLVLLFITTKADAHTELSPIKPDIHLIIVIKSDGSNTVSFEVYVHPLISPLLKQGLETVYSQLAASDRRRVQITETKHYGKRYNTISIQFSSLDELNNFMQTSQFFSELINNFIPNANFPALFSEFYVSKQETEKERRITVQAHMEPETTTFFKVIDFSIHFHMPFHISAHNADEQKNKELTWRIKPGQSLSISIQAVSSKNPFVFGLNKFRNLLSNTKILLGASLGLLLVIGVAFFVLRSRKHSHSIYNNDSWGNW